MYTDLLDFDPLIQESLVLFQGSVPVVQSQILHRLSLELHDRQPIKITKHEQQTI